ncbi:MAG TPA: site-2 protease family protein [Acidobacteriaceae bacterium]|nr:site-2 protease family protein [Acidobacteriaceae bacterium]
MPSLQLVIALYEFVILLFSLSAHASAQSWMASRLGDHTARLEGRISLNPARHIDPLGTFLYPALMIFGPLFGFTWFGDGSVIMGWGRQVPIMSRNLKKITRDSNLITLAGPAANLLVAIAGFLLLVVLILAVPGGRVAVGGPLLGSMNGAIDTLPTSAVQALALIGMLAIEINLGLIIFNILPIPPLDGGRILRNILPYNALATFDQIGRFSTFLIFFFGDIFVRLLLPTVMRIVMGVLAVMLGAH